MVSITDVLRDKSLTKNPKNRIYSLLLFEAVIIFCIHVFNINKLYGFFLSEDELGYWGNAAFLMGKDWGNTVSFCPYYSHGYSLFLILIMALPVQPLMTYRIAIAANALFMAISFFISYYIFTRLYPQKDKVFVSICCTAMALYTSYIAQSSVAWSECYLVLWVWLILLQVYLICKNTTMLRVIVLGTEAVYLYMIHQRTVAFLISSIVFVCIWHFAVRKINKMQMAAAAVIMGGMFFATIMLKNYMQSAIYASGDLVNTYSGALKGMNFSNLFIPVVKTACGQIFYLWSASFGIIPLGIAAAIYACIKNWKEKKLICYFYGFVLLSFVGVFAISCIWMRLRKNLIDYSIYGRFNEIISGFFIVIGFMVLSDFVKEIKKGKRTIYFLGISIAIFTGCAAGLFNRFSTYNVSPTASYQGVGAAGCFWFYSLRGELRVWELFLIVLSVSFILFGLGKKLADKKWIFTTEVIVMALFWIWSGEQVIKKQIIPYQAGVNYDLTVKNDLLQYIRNNDSVIFLTNSPRYSSRGSLQLYMQDKPLIVQQDLKNSGDKPDILIIDSNVINGEYDSLSNYYLAGLLSDKKVYSLNEIELDKNLFSFQQVESDEEGCVMFGPYISLSSGEYEATFYMNGDSVMKDKTVLGIADIAEDGGNHIICSSEWDGTSQSITMNFYLEQETDNIEFRYFKNKGNNIVPLKVMLKKINDTHSENEIKESGQ